MHGCAGAQAPLAARDYGCPPASERLEFDERDCALIDTRSSPLPHSLRAGSERLEFDEPDFALIDTLFSLAEAHLYMQLVEMQVGCEGLAGWPPESMNHSTGCERPSLD